MYGHTLPNFISKFLFFFTQGFEPRGTELSNRLITMKNLDKASLSKYNVSQAKTRHLRSVSNSYCQRQSYARLVFQSTSTSSLLTAKNLKAMCQLEKEVMKSTSGFDNYYYGGSPERCPSLSLGNLVAEVGRKGSCENITDFDVQMGLKILQNCSVYFAKGLLNRTVTCYCDSYGYNSCPSIPCQCSSNDNAVFNTLNYLTDSDFLKTPSDTNLKYSLVMSPIYDNYDLFNYIYEKHLKDSLPEYNGVKVAAFDFGNFKFDLFNKLLIENTKYPAIAMVFVLIIMCLFLNSIILSICTMFCIIFALVFSYFLYNIVFGISFFPFLNVITLVFLVGIGADDAFVYYDIWRQTKCANPDADIITLTFKTLRYAALSMFVTSFTTSAAFFASVTSHITSIKCFGIYAGLSILTNYLIMVTWFPAVVILHERWVRKRPVKPSPRLIQEGPVSNEVDGRDGAVQNQSVGSEPNDGSRSSLACLVCWAIDFPCHFIPGLKTFFSKMNQKLFDHWLPVAVIKKKLHFLWIFLFFGLTIGFLCVILVKPGLNLPTSKDFQVFSSSSNVEKYDLGIKYKFRFNQVRSWGLPVFLVWGMKEVDNGDYLNPDNKGTLEYENSFDPFSEESQKWMLSLCKSIRKQSFYTTKNFGETSACAIEKFIDNCKNQSFPFPRKVFQNSCSRWDDDRWSKYPKLLYNENKKSLVMTMWFETNVQWTAAYDKMDDFWKSLKTWESEIFATAPSGMKNGWLVSYDLEQMYNLQDSLKQGTFSSLSISVAIAFGVMLLTTLNIFISIYAIVTIIGIIAISVGCLVLLGWQLNILESIVMSVAVGLSIDFTMHYGVAYRLSPHKEDRELRVRYSFSHIGSAISMAALTTFTTGIT